MHEMVRQWIVSLDGCDQCAEASALGEPVKRKYRICVLGSRSNKLLTDKRLRATVNTLPPETLDAFLYHGQASYSLEADADVARRDLDALKAVGVDLDAITRELEAKAWRRSSTRGTSCSGP